MLPKQCEKCVQFVYLISQQIFTGEYSAIPHLKEHKKYFLVKKRGLHRSFLNFFDHFRRIEFCKKWKKIFKKLKKKTYFHSRTYLRLKNFIFFNCSFNTS